MRSVKTGERWGARGATSGGADLDPRHSSLVSRVHMRRRITDGGKVVGGGAAGHEPSAPVERLPVVDGLVGVEQRVEQAAQARGVRGVRDDAAVRRRGGGCGGSGGGGALRPHDGRSVALAPVHQQRRRAAGRHGGARGAPERGGAGPGGAGSHPPDGARATRSDTAASAPGRSARTASCTTATDTEPTAANRVRREHGSRNGREGAIRVHSPRAVFVSSSSKEWSNQNLQFYATT